jgi:hypothetical protein
MRQGANKEGRQACFEAHSCFHGCTLSRAARLSGFHCTQPHPCTVTAADHPHTRPPDAAFRLEYLGSLVNTYCTLDLRRIPRNRYGHRRTLVVTRTGEGTDLPGVHRTMTGSDDDAPAARGQPLGARARRPEGRESSRAWRPADFPAPSIFTGCTVRCHEDVPRHIYGLFEALGIQYRWVLTRGSLGRALVTAKDLAIDDAKEESWMAVHENERDLLEDTVYRRLVSLRSEIPDAYAVFDKHGPAQLAFVRSTGMGSPSRGFPSQAQAHANCPSCSRDWTPYDMGRQLHERCQQPFRKSRQNPPSFQIHGLGRAHNRRRFSVRHSGYPQIL